MFVRNWMTSPPVVVRSSTSAGEALRYLEKRQIRRLPVIEDRRLVGIVTKSDLYAAFGKDGKSRQGQEQAIEKVMTKKPFTVAQEDTLERAASLMLEKKVSGLPVVDGDRVIGIITESDVFRALCQIMGVGEQGARVIMSVKESEDLLAVVRKRLNGLTMRSLTTYHNPLLGHWEVVVRVRGRSRGEKTSPE